MTGISWRRWAWRIATAAVLVTMLALLLPGRYESVFGPATGAASGGSHEAPCLPGKPVPVMDSPHISPAESDDVRYNSVPPTSGPHFPFTIATGIYRSPVREGLSVQAMERGHVVIQYAPDTPDGEVEQLTRLAKRYGADVVLAPYLGLDDGIALTAWGRIDTLDSYHEARIATFVERLRDRYQHGWTTAGSECPG